MYVIGRHIEGICLNGLEWLLTAKGKDRMQFATKNAAQDFLIAKGCKREDLESYTFKSVRPPVVKVWMACADRRGCDCNTCEWPTHLN